MSAVNFKYECGDLLKDKVTGITGIVMVRAEYSTGCHHYGLQNQKPKDNGDAKDWRWLDQSQVKRVKKAVVKFDIDANCTSGPMPEGPSY